MGKSDIDKLDEQIKTLLDTKKNVREESDVNHIIFVDRLDTDYSDEEEVTKRIEKIDDISQEVNEENSSDTYQIDREIIIQEDKKIDKEDDEVGSSLLLIFFLILIIFSLCIILFLFF